MAKREAVCAVILDASAVGLALRDGGGHEAVQVRADRNQGVVQHGAVHVFAHQPAELVARGEGVVAGAEAGRYAGQSICVVCGVIRRYCWQS